MLKCSLVCVDYLCFMHGTKWVEVNSELPENALWVSKGVHSDAHTNQTAHL